MTTLLLSHPLCLGHDPGPGHPERIDRLRAVLAALDTPDFDALLREEAPEATVEQLARVHGADLVGRLCAVRPAEGERAMLDADTLLSAGSIPAALRAAGAVVRAVDRVVAGEASNAFCAVRPPGHHAEPRRPMGFCVFANAAVGARHALAQHGLERVAVLDFDVHHGNGTQAAFWDEPRVFFGSSHQMPLYPGTGAPDERGAHDQIVNVALEPGAGGARFRAAWQAHILPRLEAFRPGLILVSAGFDGHRADPLANLRLEAADFAWLSEAILEVAGRVCGGRVISTLEGGYDLVALSESAAAHVAALMRA